MTFRFKEFAQYVHNKFQEFSLDEVMELLDLEDDGYNKSDPQSPQKKLKLDRIIITGTKGNNVAFRYDKCLHTGVSLWIADNLKGKSTIFKAIKFALTGRENFTPLMKSWINAITLQFSISINTYTIQLNLSGSQLKGSIFQGEIALIESMQPLKSFTSKDGLASFMQGLFFEEFGYYPIKRVQATQASVSLSDADLTWVTYYSSIYQQSRDYGSLEIGNQHSLVFQVLLGLNYTYSIHALDVKARVAEREYSIKLQQKRGTTKSDEEIDQVKRQLLQIDERIRLLTDEKGKQASKDVEITLKQLYTELDSERLVHLQSRSKKFDSESARSNEEVNLRKSRDQRLTAQREINKLLRLKTEYQEYIDSGILFSNLTVTECPHCNHDVDPGKVARERASHVCSLCDHEIIPADTEKEIWLTRIAEAEQEIHRYQKLSTELDTEIREITDRMRSLSAAVDVANRESTQAQDNIKRISGEIELKEIELSRIKGELQLNYFEEYERVLKEKVRLEYELHESLQSAHDEADQKLKRKAELLRYGHALLLRRRAERGFEILLELEGIMLRQLHALGLRSYTKVTVNPTNFLVTYHQEDITSSFNDISEGEQLRAKLALYLSLIELDINNGVGRHPRLLILDSPTKEEGDSQFVEGLKNSLAYIEATFGEGVQVLVGSANRDLSDAVSDPGKIEVRQIGEFVF